MLYLLNIRACSTSDSAELGHMNAEFMMHGFLHVPNASASRAAHVNLKRSQGVCLILEFLHIRILRSSTLKFQVRRTWNTKRLAPLAHLVSTISRMSSKCWNITYSHEFWAFITRVNKFNYLNSHNFQTLVSFECIAPVISLRVVLLFRTK